MGKENGEVKEKKVPTLMSVLEKYDLKIIKEYDSVDRLPTGSLYLDEALGGGWAIGRIQELWGQPSFGKSLMAMITIGRTLRMGKKAVLFDLENSFDPKWARHFIDIDDPNFILVQQHSDTYGERILDTILAICHLEMDASPDQVGLIVLDSKDALTFEAEVEGVVGQSNMGVRSQRLSYFIRRTSQIVGDSNCAFLFISQVRANFGDTYNPLTTAGGWAMDHFAAMSIRANQLSKLTQKVNNKDVEIGKLINLFSFKNKTFEAKLNAGVRVREYETAEGSLWTVDTAYEVIDFGTRLGLFTNKSGEAYSGAGNVIYDGQDLGNKAQAQLALNTEPILLGQLEAVIRQKMGW